MANSIPEPSHQVGMSSLQSGVKTTNRPTFAGAKKTSAGALSTNKAKSVHFSGIDNFVIDVDDRPRPPIVQRTIQSKPGPCFTSVFASPSLLDVNWDALFKKSGIDSYSCYLERVEPDGVYWDHHLLLEKAGTYGTKYGYHELKLIRNYNKEEIYRTRGEMGGKGGKSATKKKKKKSTRKKKSHSSGRTQVRTITQPLNTGRISKGAIASSSADGTEVFEEVLTVVDWNEGDAEDIIKMWRFNPANPTLTGRMAQEAVLYGQYKIIECWLEFRTASGAGDGSQGIEFAHAFSYDPNKEGPDNIYKLMAMTTSKSVPVWCPRSADSRLYLKTKDIHGNNPWLFTRKQATMMDLRETDAGIYFFTLTGLSAPVNGTVYGKIVLHTRIKFRQRTMNRSGAIPKGVYSNEGRPAGVFPMEVWNQYGSDEVLYATPGVTQPTSDTWAVEGPAAVKVFYNPVITNSSAPTAVSNNVVSSQITRTNEDGEVELATTSSDMHVPAGSTSGYGRYIEAYDEVKAGATNIYKLASRVINEGGEVLSGMGWWTNSTGGVSLVDGAADVVSGALIPVLLSSGREGYMRSEEYSRRKAEGKAPPLRGRAIRAALTPCWSQGCHGKIVRGNSGRCNVCNKLPKVHKTETKSVPPPVLEISSGAKQVMPIHEPAYGVTGQIRVHTVMGGCGKKLGMKHPLDGDKTLFEGFIKGLDGVYEYHVDSEPRPGLLPYDFARARENVSKYGPPQATVPFLYPLVNETTAALYVSDYSYECGGEAANEYQDIYSCFTLDKAYSWENDSIIIPGEGLLFRVNYEDFMTIKTYNDGPGEYFSCARG